jgi:DNA (cytosine-5)-methyltransferase 1
MLRAIQEIKPKFVIAENVFGITNIDGGLVFQQVCLDLETEGYEVQPFIIPACSKNAPHRRDRVWFVATDAQSKERRKQPQENRTGKNRLLINYDEIGNVANTNGTNNKARSHGKILGQPDRQKTNGHINVERPNQWQNFPTQSPVCGGDDGIPTELDGIAFSKWRNESIKGYGNAIVPQIAYQLFQIINEL